MNVFNLQVLSALVKIILFTLISSCLHNETFDLVPPLSKNPEVMGRPKDTATSTTIPSTISIQDTIFEYLSIQNILQQTLRDARLPTAPTQNRRINP